MKRETDTMNNLNQDCDKTGPPDILKDLNIGVEPSAPPPDEWSDDEDNKTQSAQPFTAIDDDLYDPKKPYPSYVTKAPGVLVEIQDIKEKERKRRTTRKIKKSVGILGWLFCAPLMLCGLCIRDKPDVNEDEEWKDDMCLPCYYDVNYRYPGER